MKLEYPKIEYVILHRTVGTNEWFRLSIGKDFDVMEEKFFRIPLRSIIKNKEYAFVKEIFIMNGKFKRIFIHKP